MKREFVARSVMLHPDECCLVFVDMIPPIEHGIGMAGQGTDHRDILRAAAEFSVPVFATYLSDERERLGGDDLIPAENRMPRSAINPWKDEKIRDRIFALERYRLILAGGCAEGSLSQTALSALQDMYDVHLLFDLSDEELRFTASPIAQRLIQTGVVPMTARQLLLEWTDAVGTEDETCG
ncbi:hypothetical protein HFP57_07490 [Parasphingopyxis algicola]|uniref:hypothetical protein n=1 Tax=Parasphingopyxis algicola TaxID=2026624 RepID=UPI0015A43BF1|nr:hypothetical protein [Parasphingopyxis algicola]QLC24885.1 hypothetical protein HFP57_07490 [Parasphingopyxis algicola]